MKKRLLSSSHLNGLTGWSVLTCVTLRSLLIRRLNRQNPVYSREAIPYMEKCHFYRELFL